MEINDLHLKANASLDTLLAIADLRELGNAYLLDALEECGRIRGVGAEDARSAEKLAGKIRAVLLANLGSEPVRPQEVRVEDSEAAASQVIIGEVFTD